MLAPDNREPKISEAWFNSSLKIKQPWKNTHKKISLQSKTIDYKKKIEKFLLLILALWYQLVQIVSHLSGSRVI